MPSKYPARNLTTEEIDHCLMVLAVHGANAKKAHEQLMAHFGPDKTPSPATLRGWRASTHIDRYHEIAAGIDQAQRDQRMTTGFREIALQAQDSMASILNRLSDEADQLETKELAKTAQQLAVTAGIATEKTLLLEGRPTAILETRNPDWYEQQLQERLTELGLDVDGTADEITDAQVIPSSTEE